MLGQDVAGGAILIGKDINQRIVAGLSSKKGVTRILLSKILASEAEKGNVDFRKDQSNPFRLEKAKKRAVGQPGWEAGV